MANPSIRLLAPPASDENHVHHLFVVCCEARDRLAEHLRARGIESLIHYPVPAHQQAPCARVRCDPQGLSVAENHARTCLSIPCHPQLSDAEVTAVIEALNEFR